MHTSFSHCRESTGWSMAQARTGRPVTDPEAESPAGEVVGRSVRPQGNNVVPEGTAPNGDDEPDVRFTYANERTFLAWNRTALALIATGVAATQLLPKLQVEWGRRALGPSVDRLGRHRGRRELAAVACQRARHAAG